MKNCNISFEICIVILFFCSAPVLKAENAKNVSKLIKETFEASLYKFEPAVQRHWAERMFRLTGQEDYVYPIIFDALISIDDLKDDLINLSSPEYLKARDSQLISELNANTRKGGLRSNLFKNRAHDLFQLNLLTGVWKLHSYGLCGSLYDSLCVQCCSYLKTVDFQKMLLDTAVILDYSPQAVNAIYYLYFLGIEDLRSDYKSAFQHVFPDESDRALSAEQFDDKIYGLTHFITAASGYYQSNVDSSEFAWILNYFENNSSRILSETNVDVIAEMGICFLLVGMTKHPIVKKCQEKVLKKFDRERGLIPSSGGGINLARDEHRNILVYMLLNWSEKRWPGPNLSQFKQFLRIAKEHLPIPK